MLIYAEFKQTQLSVDNVSTSQSTYICKWENTQQRQPTKICSILYSGFFSPLPSALTSNTQTDIMFQQGHCALWCIPGVTLIPGVVYRACIWWFGIDPAAAGAQVHGRLVQPISTHQVPYWGPILVLEVFLMVATLLVYKGSWIMSPGNIQSDIGLPCVKKTCKGIPWTAQSAVRSDNNSASLHQKHYRLRLITYISTTVYICMQLSELGHRVENESSETSKRGIRTRALSIASPTFYRCTHNVLIFGWWLYY